MLRLLIVLLLAKLLLNAYKYFRTRALFARYEYYVSKPTWEFSQSVPQIVSMFNGAGVTDAYVPHVEPVGFGRIQTGNVSVFSNLTVTRQDVVGLARKMFHQAIGTYRARAFDAVNPFFWLEFIITLPRQALTSLGVPPAPRLRLLGSPN